MKYLLAILLMAGAGLIGCSRPDEARRVLKNDGFKNIEITGWRPFSCDNKDTFSTGFSAEKDGRKITGCVCSGFLKGNTIRFD